MEYFYNDQKQIQIFVIKENNEVIAILPFFLKKKNFGFDILSLIGDGFTDYNFILLKKNIISNQKN